MPSLHKVAAHWLDRDEWPEYRGNYVGLGEPFCSGCGWLPPVSDGHGTDAQRWSAAAKYIDRAHLADHTFGGSDGAENLVPLCHLCHSGMPSFRPGSEAEALEWVKARPACALLWQRSTDATRSAGSKAQRVLHAAISSRGGAA